MSICSTDSDCFDSLSPVADGHNQPRHILHPDDQIDSACCDGAVRHAAVLGRRPVRTLSKCKTASSLDGFEPQRSIMTGAGQHDADRILAEISGHTIEELVDWSCLARDVGCEVSQLQPALLQGRDVTGRNNVDAVRFNQDRYPPPRQPASQSTCR